jgi:hypothetical protein
MPPRLIMPASSYRASTPPRGPASAYKSYVIVSPRDTTVRTACEDAGCKHWREGWESLIDERTDLGKQQAHYIRQESRRSFTEKRTAEGLTVFRFESGQRCFADHRTRPERYIERGGDFRGNPRGDRLMHTRAADWVESSSIHQDRLAEAIKRG